MQAFLSIVVQIGVWAVFVAIAASGSLASVSAFALKSPLATITTIFMLASSIWAYQKITMGGPRHLRVAMALCGIGFLAMTAYLRTHPTPPL